MSVVVSKFGGTSMGDATCMLRSAEISFQHKSNIIVVSATSGTTNNLLNLSELAKNGQQEEIAPLQQEIKAQHLSIAKELNADSQSLQDLQKLLTEVDSITQGIYLLRDCSEKTKDALLSLGERMSSVLFTVALQKVFAEKNHSPSVTLLDVRTVLKTDDKFGKARPLTDTIIQLCKKKLADCLDKKTVYVTQGFIGQTLAGATTTLGRGGSDYTAAILAEGISAHTLEIWTDVAGVSTTDPRLCSDAVVIDEITFKEMSELATFGAKVLHPATLLPAIRSHIPVLVASSFDPQKSGTWVRKEVKKSPLIRALALRKNQTLVTLSTPEMLYAHGFLFQIFKIFNDHKVSIDAITTSEISVAVTLDNVDLNNKNVFDKLTAELSNVADVQIENKLSLISLIGNNINHTPGLAKKIFAAIADINVRMICYGASRHNFCFLVEDTQGVEVIQRLHKQFINNDQNNQGAN